jgi:regulatory protein
MILLSLPQIIQKIKHYCSYQERSCYEVLQKLYGYGLQKNQIDEIIKQLTTENYLNEEKFASVFATGKFRMKYWGRIKIKYALQQKKVNNYNIQAALDAIDEEDYLSVLQKLTTKKWKQLKSETLITKKAKTQFYLLQKGYEKHLIKNALDIAILQERQSSIS